MLFENPRAHTGKGYRQKKDAVRGCAKCGDQKKRTEYSANQWKAGPGKSVCSKCVVGGGGVNNKAGDGKKSKKNNRENGGGNTKSNNSEDNGIDGDSFPRLSEDALKEHTKRSSKSSKSKGALKVKNEMERRQFNCPLCPEEGRGKNVFFKRVPSNKPMCKCPKCKKVKQGDCERLYPIPKGEEKGYGKQAYSCCLYHLKCHRSLCQHSSYYAVSTLPVDTK